MNVTPVSPSLFVPAADSLGGPAAPSGGKAFGTMLEQVVASNSKADATANQAVESLATGQADNLHAVSLAVAQADLSFRLVLELRNRMTEAYQEIMRMQV